MTSRMGVVLAGLAFAAVARAGGEIGNGRWIAFRSPLTGVELSYPADWQQFEVGEAVSFVESGQSSAEASVVSVDVQAFGQIQTLDDLERHLRFFQPEAGWKATELGGKQGFASGPYPDAGVVYVLDSPGVVKAVRYRSRGESGARGDVHAILSTISFQ